MTIKEAVLKSMEEIREPTHYKDILKCIQKNSYYDFSDSKTPDLTISGTLTGFIQKGDTRVQRVKNNKGKYLYYLTKNEQEVKIRNSDNINKSQSNNTYLERDLHKLFSTYLKNKNIFTKTIFHEQSKYSNDNHQKWIHPDMIGINFINLSSKANQSFMKVLKKEDTFKLTSYEIKKEINTDYELKKSYFQAVSNSSWANYGYLIAFEINSSLREEMERLNQSFGIGIIELKSNPFESKVLFQAKLKELDFKTIDKLCKVNQDFENFIKLTEKSLTAKDDFDTETIEKRLIEFCDNYFLNDSEIEEYCKKVNIPTEVTDNKT